MTEPTGSRPQSFRGRAKKERRPQQERESTLKEPRPGYTALGEVLRAHGLRGELRVHAFNVDAPHLQRGSNVYVAEVRHRVVQARPDRGAWIIELSGVPSRTMAEALQGELVEAPDHEIAPEEGAFFVHELLGMAVVTVEGKRLGELVEVLATGANDVYVARGEDGREVLIPAIGEVVTEIDPVAREIRITPLPGLLDDSP